jgi:hypothetical protein
MMKARKQKKESWGVIGNRLRNRKLTAAQRSQSARKAVNARWEKYRREKAARTARAKKKT